MNSIDNKLEKFDKILDTNTNILDKSCIDVQLMMPLAKEAGFTEYDIPGLIEYLNTQKKMNQKGGSNTRKNRLKKKHTKKNKTQRGGNIEEVGNIVLAALALILVAALTMEPGGNDRNWGPRGLTDGNGFALTRRNLRN
jgi:hypothetical protein